MRSFLKPGEKPPEKPPVMPVFMGVNHPEMSGRKPKPPKWTR